jgi:hypothetical protein
VCGDPSGVGLMVRGDNKSYETLSDLVKARQALCKYPIVIEKQESAVKAPSQYASLDMLVKRPILPGSQPRDRASSTPVIKAPSPTQSRLAMRGSSSSIITQVLRVSWTTSPIQYLPS